MVFLQALYNLSGEDFEHQVLDRMSLRRFCHLDGELHIRDARMLWAFKQRLAQGVVLDAANARERLAPNSPSSKLV